uniref:MOP flippase family protein n=1 Tax=uncultured Altererythrobacter sp. TaxID=500840 RepID=UPI00260A4D44|nr:MOP flippase family protein [uncultured Altererythrobacter sp.]
MSLTARSFSAAQWTTASSVSRAALQFMQIAVLARLLSPTDYGLMAMVTVVLSYAALFSDMGLSTAFVQRQKVTHEERSSLYWLTVMVGVGLTLLVMVSSPAVAWYFTEPELQPLLLLAATNFLAISLGQQLRMDAEKALNFRPVALIEISAGIVAFLVAIATAWLNWGVYALVFAAMTNVWLTTVLSWIFLAKGWRPAIRLRWGEVRWFARFGGTMVINNVINHANGTIDLILGGRMLGAAQLGIYSVPRSLILQLQGMVNPIFSRVGFPLIAMIQDDPERVRKIYLKVMNLTASINAPAFLAIAAFAPEIVSVLLGEGWSAAAPMLRVLALWGLLRSFGNPVGSLLLGMGRVGLSAKWNAALLFVAPPFIWFGSQWGALGMAWSMSALMLILFVPAWAFLIRPVCGAKFLDYLKSVAAPVLAAAIATAVALSFASLFDVAIPRLAVGLTTGFFTYLIACILINREFTLVITQYLSSRIDPTRVRKKWGI